MKNQDLRWGYTDPVVEVERDAYRRGFNRGILEAAIIIGILCAIAMIVAGLR